MRILKTNTAVRLVVGPFISYSDGYTRKTGLTVTGLAMYGYSEADDGSAPTVRMNNVSFTASGGGTNDMIELAGGLYDIEITATQTNFIGRLKFMIYDDDQILPYFEDWYVLPALVFDSLFKGTDNLQVDAIQCSGTTLTARDLGASVLLSSGTGAGQISLSSGTVTVGTNNDKTGYTASTVSDKTGYSIADSTSDAVIADAVWNALTASYGSANTYGALLESGNVGGGAIVAASVTAAVTAGTVSDKTGYSLTQAFPSNFSSLAITGGGAVTVGTNNDKTGYTASTVSDKTGYSISGTKQTLDALNDITAASVWAVGTRALTDKAGFSISGTKTTLDALNDITAASVWAVGTREITGGTVGTVTNGVSLADTSSDAVIADAVWNALTATYGGTGSYGEKVESLVTGASADDVWDEVVDSTYTARQLIRGISSVLFGESAGGGTSTLTFRDLADTKTRITATVDADGNRTGITINSLT